MTGHPADIVGGDPEPPPMLLPAGGTRAALSFETRATRWLNSGRALCLRALRTRAERWPAPDARFISDETCCPVWKFLIRCGTLGHELRKPNGTGDSMMLLVEHDLFRKPVSTFRDHALVPFPIRHRERLQAVNTREKAMRYLSAVCFLAIAAFADAGPAAAQQSPAAAQQSCACFCRVQGESGGGCWVDVPGCERRSGIRACSDGAMCGYNCGTPGLPARRSAPRAHPLGQHYQPTEQPR
jgi:hypothetical protein